MFIWCFSLYDLYPLRNWNVSNGRDFYRMFYGCELLADIKALKNWDLSNVVNFKYIFRKCHPSIDLDPILKCFGDKIVKKEILLEE